MKRKMMSIILCTLMFAAVFVVEAPVNASMQVIEEWVAIYNGPGNDSDWAEAMAIGLSGNVYVTGGGHGDGKRAEYATIKYDTYGNELWVARYDGLGASDIGIDISENIYVTGWSTSLSSKVGCDYTTLAYDSSGNQLWVARYNPNPEWGANYAYAIAVSISGNVYITGSSLGSGTDYDYATVAYDSSGNELWVARYNGPINGYECGRDVVLDSSGNVYVTGWSQGSGTSSDYATIAYDPLGSELWVARYSNLGADRAYAMTIDSLDNIYVTGYCYGFGDHDYVTIKYDPDGKELWAARYNGPGNYQDEAHAITTDFSGNIYVTGFSWDDATGYDCTTIKYDPNGNELWVSNYNGPENSWDRGNAITTDSSGNVYVTGYSKGDETAYITIAYDASGNELWVARHNCPANWNDGGKDIAVDSSGNIYVTGHGGELGTNYDYVTIKYSQVSPNQPPVAEASLDQIVYEGDAVNFDGSASHDSDGTIESYEWDFDEDDGLWWETGAALDAVGITTTHIYGDDGVFTVTLRVTDNQVASAIDTCNITVLNVDPTVTIELARMDIEIGLRVAGRKYNEIDMTLYEDGTPVGHASIERLPGSPNVQMVWIPVTLDMTKSYTATVIYTPESRYNIGANPVWLYTKFKDGSVRKIHHTFNVQQSKKRDSDHWNHVEPWEVDLNKCLIGHQFEIISHITDPGSDDETLTYAYGSQVVTFTYLNNPPNLDIYPSPEIKPVDIMDTTTLVYEGLGTVTLIVKDDDNVRLGIGQGFGSIGVM